MRDVYEVLREKEQEFERLRYEIEALSLVLPLLADQGEAPADILSHSSASRQGTSESKPTNWP